MLELKHQKTKTLSIKPNGRSSDYVSPNFMLSCNAGCSYCYTYRFGRNKVYINDNIEEILLKIEHFRQTLPVKKANQTDDKYWTIDVACDTDISFHWKDYNWSRVFEYFTNSKTLKATFATKFVNNQLLKYGNKHLRIRFSLMPQNIADIVEKSTTKMDIRIKAINRFIENNWDVHINFSPVIFYNGWKEDYKNLFEAVNEKVFYKDKVKCEVIFLTHNEFLHNKNLQNGLMECEKLLWIPEIQENKISQYGGTNVRYQWQFKNELIEEFKQLHQEIIPWCTIRYIF